MALRCTQAYGAEWDLLKGTEGLVSANPNTHHGLPAVLGGVVPDVATGLSVWLTGEGYGADHFECYHTAYTRQQGDQVQPTGVCERQILPD